MKKYSLENWIEQQAAQQRRDARFGPLDWLCVLILVSAFAGIAWLGEGWL